MGGLWADHLGNPIPSPALLRPLHDRFAREVTAFAEAGQIPVVHFERKQRKDDVAAEHRARFTKAEGVVFIGVAQERASAFKARKLTGSERGVLFEFSRQSVAVNHYYFHVQDREWGPGFVKVGTYLPYPVRVCLNGHEWAKQQARQVGLEFTGLDNGFLTCDDPARLRAICDGLGPADVQRFFDRWSAHLPWPLTSADRIAGYEHRLSIWQLEVSRTQVFDQPVQGRHFFEAVIRENLDLGRPIASACCSPSGSPAARRRQPTATGPASSPPGSLPRCTSGTSTRTSSSTSKRSGRSEPRPPSMTRPTSSPRRRSTPSRSCGPPAPVSTSRGSPSSA